MNSKTSLSVSLNMMAHIATVFGQDSLYGSGSVDNLELLQERMSKVMHHHSKCRTADGPALSLALMSSLHEPRKGSLTIDSPDNDRELDRERTGKENQQAGIHAQQDG